VPEVIHGFLHSLLANAEGAPTALFHILSIYYSLMIPTVGAADCIIKEIINVNKIEVNKEINLAFSIDFCTYT
jgi:hypothetical protein